MSSERQLVPQNLANYGPTIDKHRAHVAGQLGKYRSKSTQKQYERKYEEYCKFSMAVFGDTEITVDRSLQFLHFQAHKEKQITEETLDKALERCLNPQKRKRHKKLATPPKAQNMSSMWTTM